MMEVIRELNTYNCQANQTLKHGQEMVDKGITRVALSPKPITTGKSAGIRRLFFNKNKHGFFEFRLLMNSTILTQMLAFLVVFCLIGGIYYFIDWGLNLTSFFLAMIPLACVFIIYYLHLIDWAHDIQQNPPIRFHPQRQAVLLPKPKLRKPIRHEMLKNDFSFFMMMITILGGFVFLLSIYGFSTGTVMENEKEFIHFLFIITALIIPYPCYYTLKPWFAYFKAMKTYDPNVEMVAVDWEEIHIEYQTLYGENDATAKMDFQYLTFYAIDESDPSGTKKKALYSIDLDSKAEGIAIYEFLRSYMENGAKGIEHTVAADVEPQPEQYSRAAYKALVKKRLKENPLVFPFWWLINFVTLRYFIHWFYEYLYDYVQQKPMQTQGVIKWSKPIPEEEWVAPSAELTAINQEVRALYKQGETWESDAVQQVVQGYWDE